MTKDERRAYAAGLNCERRAVGSHIYGLGHRSPEEEAAFAQGLKDAREAKEKESK